MFSVVSAKGEIEIDRDYLLLANCGPQWGEGGGSTDGMCAVIRNQWD